MKRYFLFIVLLAASISMASAQMELGVRGGFLTTNRSFKPDRKSSSVGNANNYGLVVTNWGEKFWGIQWGIQAEVALAERGYKYLQGDTADYKLTQQMVEVPLMAQLHLTYRAVSLFLNAGPYFGYVLKQTEELTRDGITTSTDTKFLKGYDRRFQYGLTGGPGLNVHFGSIALQAEVRYYMGFAHLYNPAVEGVPSASKETGLGMFVGLMYRFK
ncbi:porin family protein [Williamwhitmania taraxaci]|uniref:Outer membrane protein beta-barrel domain-containing protein n=1 Tax=Williamwhitmania taraxaci TaxID=1640674 RepID=A0A1G6P5T0_9BACT|nr:porin family protein [Williamwhitmania taraxaci]SDC74777.1 Outer membrane protein beta-barrel domain-containing protein [Williamwhitmania taraxaci]